MKSKITFDKGQRALLEDISRYAKKRSIALYVVGGLLRDMFLGRRKAEPDFDFALDGGACSFARSLSRKIKAAYVVLDEQHGACRLIKRIGGKLTTFDFTDFRGPTIQKDLRKRDFTVNALAILLDDLLAGGDLTGRLIDPFGAAADIKKGIIRVCSVRSFSDDPLRILRAWSFAALFEWKITPETARLAHRHRKKLAHVSGERIRDELFKILESDAAFRHIGALDKHRILSVIIPEIEAMRDAYQGPYHHLDIWRHTLESLKQCESVFNEVRRRKDIKVYLTESLSATRSRGSLIKFGCLLHDIGKPRACKREQGKIKFHSHENIGRQMSVAVCRRLKLSADEIEALSRMVQAHLRPGYLADNRAVITPRAIYRFFRDTKQEAVAILLLSLADQRATRGRLTTLQTRASHERIVRRLLREYFRKDKEKKLPRLLNGDILMKRFKLSPSPLIGKILKELDELQAIGKLRSKRDAIEAAKAIIRRESS